MKLGLLFCVLMVGCYSSIRTNPEFPARLEACNSLETCEVVLNDARAEWASCAKEDKPKVIYAIFPGPTHLECEEATDQLRAANSKYSEYQNVERRRRALEEAKLQAEKDRLRSIEEEKQAEMDRTAKCNKEFAWSLAHAKQPGQVNISCLTSQEFANNVRRECKLDEARAEVNNFQEQWKMYNLQKEIAENFIEKQCRRLIVKTHCRNVWANTDQGIWEWIYYCDENDMGYRCNGKPPKGVSLPNGDISLDKPEEPWAAARMIATCEPLIRQLEITKSL